MKSIRGELDWIALKALEKDRTRRYETPSDLAEDLERHLKGEPVIAAPPSLGYRLWKLIRRNRATFITAAAVAATLLIGLATTTWQWRRAQSAILDRDVANDELKRRAADAEWSAYAVNLASAQAAMKHGAFEVARARLAACRPEFRGIEWGLLASEARQTIAEYRTVANYAIGNDNATLLVDVNERNVQAYDFDGRFIAQLLVEGNRSEHPITMSEDRSEFIGVTKDGFLRRWTLDAMPLGMPVKHVAKFDARYQPGGGGAILSCPEPTVAVVSDCTGNVVGVPMEHSGQIADAEFSPDGNTILTTTDNGEARLWDSFGRPRGGPMCHPREINYSVFSSDSKLVLTVCENERARLWSEVGQLLATFDLSGGGRAWICTASDRIITWSQRPQTAQLWNFAGEQVSPKLAHFPFIVSRPAFSTDGTRVALMAERRILQQWDMNGQAVGQRMHHDEDIWDITYSPDGRWLATADKRNHTYLWDEFGRLMCSLTPPQSAAGENSDIELCWDAEQAARLRTVFWGENSSLAMRVVEPPPIKTLTMDHSTFGIEYAAQIGAYLNPCLNRGDDASLNKGRTILIGLGATSADGSRRVLADASGLLRVFATKPDIELAVFPIDPGVPRVAFTPDGLRLILCYDSNRVEIWDGRDPDDRIVDWEAREAERRAARPIVRPWVEDLLAGTRSADELRKLIASTVDRSPLERLAASDELQIRLDALDYASHTAFENLREQHLSPRTLRAAAQSLELVPRVRLLLDERIEKWAKDANALTNAAWKIVKSADAKNPLLAETLEAAEEAARLEPAAANIITTLGVAQYRAGQYEAAATTLAQAAKLISKYSTGVSIPAFRAMAHARLNQLAEARAHLTELRALMKTPEAVNEDSQAWLREAEALIEGSAASASQPSSAPTSAATTAPTTAPSEPRP